MLLLQKFFGTNPKLIFLVLQNNSLEKKRKIRDTSITLAKMDSFTYDKLSVI